MTDPITVTQLEAAINFWRQRVPATGEEARLCAEASALASPYAMMIFEGVKNIDAQALDQAAQAAYREARDAGAIG